jgi:HSP20 family protein
MPVNRACSGAAFSRLAEPLSVDLYRGEGSLLVVAEVPGFSREEIDIDISGEILRIEGRRRAGSGDAGDSCSVRIRECIPGRFVRCVELPEAVDADSASATLDMGLLSVLLPLAGAGSASPEPLE